MASELGPCFREAAPIKTLGKIRCVTGFSAPTFDGRDHKHGSTAHGALAAGRAVGSRRDQDAAQRPKSTRGGFGERVASFCCLGLAGQSKTGSRFRVPTLRFFGDALPLAAALQRRAFRLAWLLTCPWHASRSSAPRAPRPQPVSEVAGGFLLQQRG